MKLWYFDFVKLFLGFKVEPMELWDKYRTLLNSKGIDTVLRKAHFFGQLKQESALKPIAENLNYSTNALLSLFGRHRITEQQAKDYGRNDNHKANQEMIANILYGGKWGYDNLGNTDMGDGWRYRGRGFKQITGRHNYSELSKSTGTDYLNNPDLLLNESDAMVSAIWFWNKNGLSRLADKNDYEGITKVINGGYNGLRKRIEYTNQFKIIIT